MQMFLNFRKMRFRKFNIHNWADDLSDRAFHEFVINEDVFFDFINSFRLTQ